MNKVIRIIQNYLIFSFPFVIGMMIWGAIQQQREENSHLVKILWELLAWNLMAWFAVLILFLVSLIFVPSIRENSLKRLANLKDRDEREIFITGQAATSTYISSLSLLIFLLFLSVFTFKVSNTPVEQVKDGKTKDMSISMRFELFDEPRVEKPSNDLIIESKDIPLSKTAIILVLIIWQIVSFNMYARKQIRHELSEG